MISISLESNSNVFVSLFCCELLTCEDGRQRMNLAFNRVPLVHTTQANITWEDSCEFKPALAKSSWLRTPKEGIDGCLYFPGIELPNAMSTLHHHDSDRLLSFKGAAVKVPGQGLFWHDSAN